MSNLTLGDLSITGLTDIKSFTIPAKTLFPDFNDSLVKSLEPSDQLIVSKGLINLTIRSWLLRQSGQNILIDSCVGADKNRPNHPKITAIEIGKSLRLQYGHKILNLMPTNLYGPGDNFSETESHVIPGLIARMHKAKELNQETFSIWGSGHPLREFLYVDDLSYAIEFLVNKDIDEDLLNIGSGVEISILELSKLIKKILK